MATSNTTNLGLLEKDTTTDGNDTFNIKTMLNDNWDKIDADSKVKSDAIALKANQSDLVITNQNITTNATIVTSHLSDSTYQVATGTAMAIVVPTATLTNGYSKTFIASANNNGSATTINGLPLYKPSTVIAPTLIAGKAYTVWYNLASNCFFIKASAVGTALIANVLAGQTFSTDVDTGLTGTMPNNGTLNYIPTASVQTIPLGYIGSGSTVAGVTVPVTKVLIGTTIAGQAGTMVNNSASGKIYTVSTSDQAIEAGYVDGALTSIKVKGEPALLASNIVAGNTIGTIVGTALTPNPVAGNVIIASDSTNYTTYSSTFVYLGHNYTMKFTGTVRISFTFEVEQGTNCSGNAVILKNGASYGTMRTLTNNTVTYTEDLVCSAGDVFAMFVRSVSGVSIYIANFTIGVTVSTTQVTVV